jgi:hypothetical protein
MLGEKEPEADRVKVLVPSEVGVCCDTVPVSLIEEVLVGITRLETTGRAAHRTPTTTTNTVCSRVCTNKYFTLKSGPTDNPSGAVI